MQNASRSQAGTPATKPTPVLGTEPQKQQRQTPSSEPSSEADATSGGSSESQQQQPSKARRLAHMLEHGTPLTAEDPPAAGAAKPGAEGGSQTKPKKFNEIAKAIGVELDELYGMEIALAADGSPVTVQTLKDHHANRSEFSVSQLKWEEERTRQNSELVRGNAELRELLSAIPRDKLDAGVLEKVRTKVTENANRERARTLKVIPDWQDSGTMEKELAGMAGWLEGFGFPKDYLKTVFDHRAMLMMRTAWMREQRVAAALADIEKDPPAPVGKSKATGKAPSKQPSTEPRSRGRAGLEALLQE